VAWRETAYRPASRWTRIIAAVLVPFLLAAGVILYFFPDRTPELFAWTITPRMTPLVMGSGYLAGAYFFARVATARQRVTVMVGLPAIAVFAWISVINTVLHWDRFNHSHIAFMTWVTLYILTPFIIPAMWWLHRPSGQTASDDGSPRLSKATALVIGVAGALCVAVGAVLCIAPEQLIPVWPWKITPLTARVMGSWLVLAGTVDLSIAAYRRWEGIRITLQTQLISLALILLGIPRALDVIDWANPLSIVFVTSIGVLFLGLLGLYLSMERVYRRIISTKPA
jgi:hypothetical protein